MAEGGITQGPSLAGEAGPEAVVPLPNGKTIPVQLNTAAFEPLIDPLIKAIDNMALAPAAFDPLIKKLDEVATRITDAVNKAQTVALISDLEAAGFRRGTSAALQR